MKSRSDPLRPRAAQQQKAEPLSEAEQRRRRRRVLYMLATAATALLIIAVAVVLRSVSEMKSYNDYLTQARRSYETCDYDSALAALRKAASIDRSEDCLLLMVDCYENQGNYTKALEILRSMNTSDPEISTRISPSHW